MDASQCLSIHFLVWDFVASFLFVFVLSLLVCPVVNLHASLTQTVWPVLFLLYHPPLVMSHIHNLLSCCSDLSTSNKMVLELKKEVAKERDIKLQLTIRDNEFNHLNF